MMTTSVSPRRSMLGVLAAVAVIGLAAWWVLGPNLGTWLTVLRLDARDQMEKLIDKQRYQLVKAQAAVGECRERVEKLREAFALATSDVKRRETALAGARRELDEARRQLEVIELTLSSGKAVRTVSGRQLSSDEVHLRVKDQGQRIELAKQKIAFHADLLKRAEERRDKLTQLHGQAPLELARLELSVRHLEEKVKMYQEQRELLRQEKEANGSVAGLFEKAQQTLEAAHADIDSKLAGLNALLDASRELAGPPSNDSTRNADLLAEVRNLLGSGERLAATN